MKKKLLKSLLIAIAVILASTAGAQQVATFEDLTLAPNSYWDGSKTKKTSTLNADTTFLSGDAIFFNRFNYSFPTFPYWQKGWAYSNQKDMVTPGKMFNSFTGSGYNSDNYAIGKDSAVIVLGPNAKGSKVKGMFVTNGTYAGLSMLKGDGIAKKFGDTTGTNSGLPQGSFPDWFKLTVRGYLNGVATNNAVDFFLADYRPTDNSKDYIVNTWEWIDLLALGNVDSVLFSLSSTDNDPVYGMNTPAFYCIDNFTIENANGIDDLQKELVKVYPNPASDYLTIDLNALGNNQLSTVEIVDVAGKKIESRSINTAYTRVPVADYRAGIYFISIKNMNTIINTKFIKN